MSSTRIDKWLWSVRIFKSRTIATDHCKSGKVTLHLQKAKPSTMVSTGDLVSVHKNGFIFSFRVVNPIEKRVSATLAREAYEDLTPADELQKHENWFTGKSGPEIRERGTGRPTKKDRREIDTFKGDYYFSD